MTLHFVNSELMLEQPQYHQIRVQKDNGKGKSFANTTWEEIYSIIKAGYDAGNYTSFYEQRDPDKPCNFHVDIDGDMVEESEFNETAYLEQIRKDFDNAGITEPWKVQSSCGLKGSGFKISYHITIPGVNFQSHKHLKRWFLDHCTQTVLSGADKNGRRTTRTEYFLGRTKIDVNVYCKGAWRYPMCVKQGSNRVLRFDGDMSLVEFKKLSIHYVEPGARLISIDLPSKRGRTNMKRGVLSAEEKSKYHLKGDFIYGESHDDGIYVKAKSGSWSCPFDSHEKNRQVYIDTTKVHCYGCDKSYFFDKRQKLDDYESKYGIKCDADIGTDDAFLTKLFMHRDGQKMVICNGQTYIQNEFGLYKSPKDSVQKVIKEFFEDFLENSEHVFQKLDKEIKEHTWQGNKATSHSQWDRYCVHKRVVARLKSNKNRGEIVKEIQCEVTNNDFDKLLDSDSFLLGFENGLLDLHTMEFRVGRSNEYVSMSCGYAFEWKTDEECKEWYDVFRTLYRSQEEMDWDWKEMSRSLVGMNKEEIAKFELGDGGNGKGVKATAEMLALGDYCKPISSSCVLKTKYTIRNGHDISLYSGRNARRWQMSELNKNDVLDTEQFKRYSGNDRIEMRTHQQKQMEYRVAPPITFSLNNPIKMTGNNQRNMVRRVVCLPFDTTFVTDEEYAMRTESERENVLVGDPNLKNKLKDDGVKCILMNILIKYYKRYCGEGLIPPLSIIKYSREFLDNTSPVTIWFRENLEESTENIIKNDLLSYYNDQNSECISKTRFSVLLEEHQFQVGNSSGVTLTKEYGKNCWEIGDKKKGICVKGVKIKNFDIVE